MNMHVATNLQKPVHYRRVPHLTSSYYPYGILA